MNPIVLPELRYRKLWLSIGIVLLLAITFVCLLPSKDLPELSLSDKTEHILAFGALTFWFASIVVRRDIPWVGIAVVMFGGMIEIAQSEMGWGRQGDWYDLAADTIGVVLGVVLVLTPLGHWARWFEAKVTKARP